jgi:hypothetical protein
MPLGAIHLILPDADGNEDTEFFCGTKDAIAAIHPVRIAHFPVSEICAQCFAAYQQSMATADPSAAEV